LGFCDERFDCVYEWFEVSVSVAFFCCPLGGDVSH
jgi:hypothetical protein